jgi:hypothetical protein
VHVYMMMIWMFRPAKGILLAYGITITCRLEFRSFRYEILENIPCIMTTSDILSNWRFCVLILTYMLETMKFSLNFG